MVGEIIPISDEQAKALQEGFKFAGQSLDMVKDVGGYLTGVLGSAPEDLVGLLGADWLRVRRAVNLANMIAKAKAKAERAGVRQPQPASLAIALPLLHAAADEDREELVDLWASLLAKAMDPGRAKLIRHSFIGIIKEMDPLDARVLQMRTTSAGDLSPNTREFIARQLNESPDAVDVSLGNLVRLGLLGRPQAEGLLPVVTNAYLSALGRLFTQAVA